MSLLQELKNVDKEIEDVTVTAPKIKTGTLKQALKNLPSSTVQLAKDIVQPIISPIDFLKSTYSLGKGVIELTIPGEQPDEKTAKAVGAYLANRYGGMSNIRDTFAEDPAGLLADAAMLLRGGGSLATKIPKLEEAGKIASKVGKKIDPTEYLYKGAKVGAKSVGTGAKELLGLTTGAGGEAIEQAFKAGRSGGDAERLLAGEMRGTSGAKDVVEQATSKLKERALERGKEYTDSKQKLKLDDIPVEFENVRKSFNEFASSKKFKGMSELSEKAQKKLSKIEKIISEFENNPKLHNAKGLDILKRRVDAEYPSGLSVGDAGLVVSEMRNRIKKQILTEAPEYGKVMKAYEQAISLEKKIMKELSLGNKTAAGTALRKLQSTMRNNVNTNYGNRLDMLKSLDPDLLPQLAGQALSNLTPRGLQGLSAGSAAAYGIPAAMAGLVDPSLLVGLPLQSPRLMGEAALKTGQAQRILSGVPTSDILRTARPISSVTRGAEDQPTPEELKELEYLNRLLSK